MALRDETRPDQDGSDKTPRPADGRDQQGPRDALLAVRADTEAAIAVVRPVGPSIGRDLVRTIGVASQALAYLPPSPDYDVTVAALTAWECVGATPADALQAGADVARQAPLDIHGLLWARIPGLIAEAWEYRLSVLISAADPECSGDDPAHTADRRPCRVRVYRDVATEAALPAGAFTALERPGMHQAEALQATADALRALPDLEVEGLLWARVPTLRGDNWEYRLTVLTASLATGLGTDDEPTYYHQQR